MKEEIYLTLLHSLGISQKKLSLIFKNKENYKDFYETLDYSKLLEFKIRKNIIKNILEKKEKINKEYIRKKLKEREVKIITIKDKDYPELLKQVSNPPYLLYVRGKIDNAPKISVVGARAISSYGKLAIEKIIPELSNYFSIVSGGAAGCDSEAHLQALKAGNKTISVIGTGIDLDYPVHNKKMYDNIVKSTGAVISIFRIGEPGNPYNFPIRNEVVAGLSVGTIIVEAKERSGSLITAQISLDLGRDLFSIPGEMFKQNSVGCNNLIKNGEAKLVSKSSDILEEYGIKTIGSVQNNKKNMKFADKIEEDIYNLLILESLTIDELKQKLNLDTSTLAFKLSMMEINIIVSKSLGGKYKVS